MKEPVISVGILKSKNISVYFHSEYILKETGEIITGNRQFTLKDNNILYGSELYDRLHFFPCGNPSASFSLLNVKIGIDFHWEKEEDQIFCGSLSLQNDGGCIHAINEINAENYLSSVISSEMSATASLPFLKAHAVISRSWLLAQLENKKESAGKGIPAGFKTDRELHRWYDREDHTLFDVCADDHCQRYQGIHTIKNENALRAVLETSGEILSYDGKICDTRFSKCCGGISESYESCWDNTPHPYLRPVLCSDNRATIPIDKESFIRSVPEAFCQSPSPSILRQILNDFDQETIDFYRWHVRYSREELSELVRHRTGIDFGAIEALIPLERGESGRITRLEIQGSKKTYIIGKELEIRRSLSATHLYSSAFVVDKTEENGTTYFTFTGAGWGHGVGLCQIGAAVMGERGYSYEQILKHYFSGAVLEKIY